MKLIKYREFFKEKSNVFLKQGLCLGKSRGAYFLGPILSARLCSNCFYLRAVSSISYKTSKFLNLSKKDEDFLVQFFLKKETELEFTKGSVIEIRNNKKYFTHHIMLIPGCEHKSYEEK